MAEIMGDADRLFFQYDINECVASAIKKLLTNEESFNFKFLISLGSSFV